MKKWMVRILLAVMLLCMFGCGTDPSLNMEQADVNPGNTEITFEETQNTTQSVQEDSVVEDTTETLQSNDNSYQNNDDEYRITYVETQFSDGVCLVRIDYIATEEREVTLVVIDTEGNIVGELPWGRYQEFNEFYNGVALLKTHDGVFEFVNKYGEVVFASDDPQYEGMIWGIYEDGYIYLNKTESSFDASVQYESVVRCTSEGVEVVYDWTSDLNNWYSYHGNGVFAVGNADYLGDDTGNLALFKSDTVETGKEYTVVGDGEIYLEDLHEQPPVISEKSEGWMIISDRPDVYAVDLENLETYYVGTFKERNLQYAKFGVCADGCIVVISADSLGYFDTETKTYSEIPYEYFSQIQMPEELEILSQVSATKFFGPALNYIKPANSNLYLATDYVDLTYSNGAMMLGLNGKDGKSYFTLIDKQGNAIMEPTVGEAVETLGCGRFEVSIDEELCVYDEYGQKAFPAYDEEKYGKIMSIGAFGNGLARIWTEKHIYAFIDPEGNVVIGTDAV